MPWSCLNERPHKHKRHDDKPHDRELHHILLWLLGVAAADRKSLKIPPGWGITGILTDSPQGCHFLVPESQIMLSHMCPKRVFSFLCTSTTADRPATLRSENHRDFNSSWWEVWALHTCTVSCPSQVWASGARPQRGRNQDGMTHWESTKGPKATLSSAMLLNRFVFYSIKWIIHMFAKQ